MAEEQDAKITQKAFTHMKVTCTIGHPVQRQHPTKNAPHTITVTPFQLNLQAYYSNHYPIGAVRAFEWPLTPAVITAMNNFGAQFANSHAVKSSVVKEAVKEALRNMDVSSVQEAHVQQPDEPLSPEQLQEFLKE